jgi:hypothetical protein
MKIKFTGVIELPEVPDERGTVDVWLLNIIEEIIENGPELDDIYDKLNLSWEVYDKE